MTTAAERLLTPHPQTGQLLWQVAVDPDDPRTQHLVFDGTSRIAEVRPVGRDFGWKVYLAGWRGQFAATGYTSTHGQAWAEIWRELMRHDAVELVVPSRSKEVTNATHG